MGKFADALERLADRIVIEDNAARQCSCGFPKQPCARTQTDCRYIQPRREPTTGEEIMPTPIFPPESEEIMELRRNDARYRIRRWNAYTSSPGKEGGDSDNFKAFAAAYDAESDVLRGNPL